MATFKEIEEKSNKYLMEIYGRFPLALEDGHDAVLIDSEGKKYDDFLSGISVCNLGYSNENVKKSMNEAIGKIIHTSNFFHVESQANLAEILCKNSFADKAFFCNSGGEANEAALKLAKKRAYNKHGDKKTEVIYLSRSFHGRTINTLNVTDSDKYISGYWGRPENFILVNNEDLEDFKKVISDKTVAVILEPIQGEGGVNPIDKAFLQEVRSLTEKYDAALIFDEIQCGMGRTGKLWAYENYGIEPDIMTLAKALANGVPIGAVLAKGDYGTTFVPGDHGTTFGGNPLATSAGLAVMEEMLNTDILSQVEAKGRYLKEKLEALAKKYPICKEVRGMGLILGLELGKEGGQIVNKLLEKGIIINCTRGNILRFLPPFVITRDQIDNMIGLLDKELEKLNQ